MLQQIIELQINWWEKCKASKLPKFMMTQLKFSLFSRTDSNLDILALKSDNRQLLSRFGKSAARKGKFSWMALGGASPSLFSSPVLQGNGHRNIHPVTSHTQTP